MIYRIVGKLGEFGKSSAIRLTKTIQISTVFIRIEAQESIFYLTQHLNESGVYLNPGVNFLLFNCPG